MRQYLKRFLNGHLPVLSRIKAEKGAFHAIEKPTTSSKES